MAHQTSQSFAHARIVTMLLNIADFVHEHRFKTTSQTFTAEHHPEYCPRDGSNASDIADWRIGRENVNLSCKTAFTAWQKSASKPAIPECEISAGMRPFRNHWRELINTNAYLDSDAVSFLTNILVQCWKCGSTEWARKWHKTDTLSVYRNALSVAEKELISEWHVWQRRLIGTVSECHVS